MTSPTELVSLAEAVAHLNLHTDSSDFDPSEVQRFIDAATTYIQRFTGPIVAQEFTETHNGGGPTVVLRNPPVLSIQSVVEYVGATGYTLAQVNLGDAIGTYSYSLDSAESGILRRRYNGGLAGSFVGGNANIVVSYTAGRGAVDADVKMAVLQDIAGLFQPSQLGGNPYDAAQGVAGGNAPLNPIGMFPRVAEILSDPAKRTPAIG